MLKHVKIPVLLLILAGSGTQLQSQSFDLMKDSSSVKINGTSNLHEWKMDLKAFECTPEFKLNGSVPEEIDKVSFTAKSADLKSESSLMERKALAALKAKEYPEIKFTLTRPVRISVSAGRFEEKITGTLEIAGKKNSVLIPVEGTVKTANNTDVIDIKGSTEISMKSYNIKPPVFMMGALKTGDKVTVSWRLRFVHRKG